MPHAARRPGLLLLALFFPPALAAGAHRSLAMANHFASASWDVTVLTAPREFFTDCLDGADTSIEGLIDPSVRVVRVPFDTASFERDGGPERGRARGAFAGSLLQARAALGKVVFPEPYYPWGYAALRRSLALHRNRPFNVVLACGSPFASFATAWGLGRLLHVPYVVDYQDGWTVDEVTGVALFPPGHPAWRWQRRVHAGAREIVFAGEGLRAWNAERYPDQANHMSVVPDADALLAPLEERVRRYARA